MGRQARRLGLNKIIPSNRQGDPLNVSGKRDGEEFVQIRGRQVFAAWPGFVFF